MTAPLYIDSALEKIDASAFDVVIVDGQRYIKHRELGGQILLFVRARKKQEGLTMPYTFFGPVDYVSHKGDRPIAFVWKLRQSMPADFFRAAKVASA